MSAMMRKVYDAVVRCPLKAWRTAALCFGDKAQTLKDGRAECAERAATIPRTAALGYLEAVQQPETLRKARRMSA